MYYLKWDVQEEEIDQKQKRNLLSKVFNLFEIFVITGQEILLDSILCMNFRLSKVSIQERNYKDIAVKTHTFAHSLSKACLVFRWLKRLCGLDGMEWMGLGWLSQVIGSLRAPSVLKSLNIFCLLSSSAYAALQFDSGLVPVCMVRSCGLLPCSVLSPWQHSF